MPRPKLSDNPAMVAERERRVRALRRFMDHYQLQAESWAKAAGVAPTAIGNFFAGRTFMLSDVVIEPLVQHSPGTMDELLGYVEPGSLPARIPDPAPPRPVVVTATPPPPAVPDAVAALQDELRQVRRLVEDLTGMVEDLTDEVRLERLKLSKLRAPSRRA